MAISRFSTSRLTQGLPKYQNAWDGVSYSSDYELIASSLISTPVSSVTFSSIPSTYQYLQMRVSTRTNTTTQDYAVLVVNGSNVSARHGMYSNGSANFALGQVGATDMGAIPKSNDPTGIYSYLVLDIADYKNTTKVKTLKWLSGYDLNGTTSGTIFVGSSLWNNTAAINQLTYGTYYGQNFAADTSIALYGLKG